MISTLLYHNRHDYSRYTHQNMRMSYAAHRISPTGSVWSAVQRLVFGYGFPIVFRMPFIRFTGCSHKTDTGHRIFILRPVSVFRTSRRQTILNELPRQTRLSTVNRHPRFQQCRIS